MIAQWILYDQCHLRYIEPGVTDVFFILFTGETISSPVGNLTFNVRSKILEYAIARSFLDECKAQGYETHWIEAKSYLEGLAYFIEQTHVGEISLMRPSEEYLARKIEQYELPSGILRFLPNRQFLINRDEFTKKFTKPPVMEVFYRYMRVSRDILIGDDKKPIGGKWNYDDENRGFDRAHKPSWNWKPQYNEYLDEALTYYHQEGINWIFPVSRSDALSLLSYFLTNHLKDFGRLEDAMYKDDTQVHHSLLSVALNFGLLLPQEVIDGALTMEVPISSKEGFIRQILGWREYMRQFYLYYYDTLYTENIFSYTEPLPEVWWNYAPKLDDTQKDITTMHCVDTVLDRVQQENYSHHIERLMIVGNYSLLREYHPHEVNRWFWEMYVDAFEWVVTPNVLAMSQYSDGGKLATKPYISGGNYIEKMSDYCTGCRYSVKEKTCPMTVLYWDFIDRNQDIYRKGRTPYILSTLAKIDIEKIRKAKQIFIRNSSSHA